MSLQTNAAVSTPMKVFLASAAVAQAAAIGAAHADLSQRSAAKVVGPKLKWRAITLLPVAGPLWYFLRGRRR